MIPVRSYIKLLYDYLRRQKLRVAALTITMFTAIGLTLVGPQLVRADMFFLIETADNNTGRWK